MSKPFIGALVVNGLVELAGILLPVELAKSVIIIGALLGFNLLILFLICRKRR